MTVPHRPSSIGALRALCLALPLSAQQAPQVVQERVDLSVVQKIRDEGLNRSHLD